MPPPAPFPYWHFRGLGGEPLLVQTFDAPRDAELELLPKAFALGYLDGWLHAPESRGQLVDVYCALFGSLDLDGWGYGDVTARLGSALRAAFDREDLVILVEPGEGGLPAGPIQPPSQRPSRPPQPQKPKTFVEIELFDGDGSPVGGEAYKITLPDGSIVRGSLDARGFARVDGIDPGTCDVEFPNIDGREWGTRPFPRSGR